MTIHENYQGLGYGTEAFNKIIAYLETLSIDYVALQPYPIKEEDKKEESIKRLINFYENQGLKVINKEGNTQLIMGRNLNRLL